MTVTHKHLEAFHAVVQAGGFTRAARQLRTSQPSISRLIGQMQDAVAFPLFSRSGGRTVPTAEALALYEEVERSFTGVDKILQQAERIRTHRVGHLRILCMPVLAHSFLPRVLSTFLREHPGVSASLQVQRSDAIGTWMATRQFDVGFAMLPQDRPGLVVEPFDPAPGVCVMPPDHPLARKRVVDIRDLQGVPLVGNGPNSSAYRAMGRLFAEAGVSPSISVETPITAIACELVANGAGIAIADPFTAHSYRARGLVARPLRQELLFHISAIYPDMQARSRLVEDFVASMTISKQILHQELGKGFRNRKLNIKRL